MYSINPLLFSQVVLQTGFIRRHRVGDHFNLKCEAIKQIIEYRNKKYTTSLLCSWDVG